MVPVLVGLMLAGVFAVANGFIRADKMAPTWAIQAALLSLFVYSYVANRGSAHSWANHSSYPTPAPGASPAGQETRHR